MRNQCLDKDMDGLPADTQSNEKTSIGDKRGHKQNFREFFSMAMVTKFAVSFHLGIQGRCTLNKC